MPRSPDTFWVRLTGFASMACSSASEYRLSSLPNVAWSSVFFCNPSEIPSTLWLPYCYQLNSYFLPHNKCFWFLRRRYGPVRTHKVKVSESDYVSHSSVQLSDHTHGMKQCTTCQRTNYDNTTKAKISESDYFHIHLYSFQITHGMKQCTTCQRTNYDNTTKAKVSESDYVSHSSVQLSDHTRNETMHNVSTHQLRQYYQSKSFRIRLRFTFICTAFRSHTEWNNAQRVNAPTTTILPKQKFPNQTTFTFICTAFRSHTEGINAQRVNAPTTMILPK